MLSHLCEQKEGKRTERENGEAIVELTQLGVGFYDGTIGIWTWCRVVKCSVVSGGGGFLGVGPYMVGRLGNRTL